MLLNCMFVTMAAFIITPLEKGLQDNLVGVFGYFDVDHKMLNATADQVVNSLFFLSF